MSDNVYLDTPGLAKWYLNEAGTQEVTDYIQSIERAVISSLTIIEMRCLLSRRKRMGDFSDRVEHQLYASFLSDIDRGYLSVEQFSDQYFTFASHLIDSIPAIPLRMLDALHLSIIQQQNISCLATADEVMLKAAKK
jgi:predicted nucleic acid-binding protein